MSRLLLIRHGQASFLQKNYDQLSPLGEEQAAVLGHYLAKQAIPFDRVYCGTLQRHQQTLESVADTLKQHGINWPTPVIMHELDEHHGPEVMHYMLPALLQRDELLKDWAREVEQRPELKSRNYLKMFNRVMRQWAKGEFEADHPQLEPWPIFRKRVQHGLKRILHENGKGRTVLAFTSGGTMSAATAFALGMTDEEKVMELNGVIQNTAIIELLFSGERLTLKSFNEVPHLKEPRLKTYV